MVNYFLFLNRFCVLIVVGYFLHGLVGSFCILWNSLIVASVLLENIPYFYAHSILQANWLATFSFVSDQGKSKLILNLNIRIKVKSTTV